MGVVYLDQKIGALQAVHWLKYYFLASNISFLHNGKKKKKMQKGDQFAQRGF